MSSRLKIAGAEVRAAKFVHELLPERGAALFEQHSEQDRRGTYESTPRPGSGHVAALRLAPLGPGNLVMLEGRARLTATFLDSARASMPATVPSRGSP